MQIAVSKWGNSLALRLPSKLARQSGLADGGKVMIETQTDGSLIITPVRAKPSLAELLAATPPDTRPAELDWGAAEGDEAW